MYIYMQLYRSQQPVGQTIWELDRVGSLAMFLLILLYIFVNLKTWVQFAVENNNQSTHLGTRKSYLPRSEANSTNTYY